MSQDRPAARPADLTLYLGVLWRRRWLVAAALAVMAGSALFFSARQAAQYESVAKVFIGPRSVEPGGVSEAIEELNVSSQLVASYAVLLRSRTLAERVVLKGRFDIVPLDLAGRIRTRIVPDTRIIEVFVTDGSAERAQRLANSVAETFVGEFQEDFGGRAGARATLLEEALRPGSPVSPKPVRDGIVGALMGLLVGLGIALLLENTDTRIRSREDVEAALSPYPLLGAIPLATPEEQEYPLFVETSPKAPTAEAFRILRTNVQFVGVEQPLRSILISSPSASDGKSTVAANLAMAMAASGRKTLLVESDLRRPMVHRYFKVPQSPGLTDVLVGRATLGQAIAATRARGLAVLPAGPLPPNPAELLGSRKMAEIIPQMEEVADVVVLDTPPALPVADAVVLGAHVDGVIVVVRAGKTHRERAREAIEAFHRLGVRVLGVVLNGVESTGGDYYYYYSQYHSRDDSPEVRSQAPAIPTTSSMDLDAEEKALEVVHGAAPSNGAGAHVSPPSASMGVQPHHSAQAEPGNEFENLTRQTESDAHLPAEEPEFDPPGTVSHETRDEGRALIDARFATGPAHDSEGEAGNGLAGLPVPGRSAVPGFDTDPAIDGPPVLETARPVEDRSSPELTVPASLRADQSEIPAATSERLLPTPVAVPVNGDDMESLLGLRLDLTSLVEDVLAAPNEEERAP